MFDVARRLLLVDVEGDTEISRLEVGVEDTEPMLRAKRMVELGVNTLMAQPERFKGTISGIRRRMAKLENPQGEKE